MAAAHAQLTGKPGVCLVTAGPGCTNLLSGVAEAYVGSLPLVVLAGRGATSTAHRGAAQEVATDRVFAPVTKWSVRVDRADLIVDVLRQAFAIARAAGQARCSSRSRATCATRSSRRALRPDRGAGAPGRRPRQRRGGSRGARERGAAADRGRRRHDRLRRLRAAPRARRAARDPRADEPRRPRQHPRRPPAVGRAASARTATGSRSACSQRPTSCSGSAAASRRWRRTGGRGSCRHPTPATCRSTSSRRRSGAACRRGSASSATSARSSSSCSPRLRERGAGLAPGAFADHPRADGGGRRARGDRGRGGGPRGERRAADPPAARDPARSAPRSRGRPPSRSTSAASRSTSPARTPYFKVFEPRSTIVPSSFYGMGFAAAALPAARLVHPDRPAVGLRRRRLVPDGDERPAGRRRAPPRRHVVHLQRRRARLDPRHPAVPLRRALSSPPTSPCSPTSPDRRGVRLPRRAGRGPRTRSTAPSPARSRRTSAGVPAVLDFASRGADARNARALRLLPAGAGRAAAAGPWQRPR